MFTQQFFIEGLGCASYLIGDEKTNTAAIIDPDRDVQKYLDAANERGLKITHIIETHLHADHVSGNTELAARLQAQGQAADIYLPQNSDAKFPHIELRGGETLTLGNLEFQILHTPGHTPESITLLIRDTARGIEPALAFTGDTLFVGDVGRPDLVGDEGTHKTPLATTDVRSLVIADAARKLAGEMYDSLHQKLLPLADGLMIYPGHGAGSLCGRAMGTMRVSTLGYERHTNPALAPRTRDEFIIFNTSDLPEQPANNKRIKAMNRQGPRVLGEIIPRALTVEQAVSHLQRGAGLLDTRAKQNYIARHIPGAVHLELNDQLSNRVGVLLPPDTQLVLLLDDAADYTRVAYMLARVGLENLAGYLENLDEWETRGYPVTSGDVQEINARELENRIANDSRLVILDVREPWEFRNGHLPNAKLIPLGQLQTRYTELDPEMPTAVICQSGARSQTAAALLAQKGFKQLFNVRDGTAGWKRRGFPLET